MGLCGGQGDADFWWNGAVGGWCRWCVVGEEMIEDVRLADELGVGVIEGLKEGLLISVECIERSCEV